MAKNAFKLTLTWFLTVLIPCREAYTAPGMNSGAVGENGRDGNATPEFGSSNSAVGELVELKPRSAPTPVVDKARFTTLNSPSGLPAASLARVNTEVTIASKSAWKYAMIPTNVFSYSSQWKTNVKKRVKLAEPA